MGLFKNDDPRSDPLRGGADGVFDVLGDDGELIRYRPEDFDEIWSTTDVHEAGRHVLLGWLLLDEIVGPGCEPGGEVFVHRMTRSGEVRTVPVRVPSEDVTTYVLGYPKRGAGGTPVA